MFTEIEVDPLNQGYTAINNHIFRNQQLSFADKGLLSTIMSLPPTWDLSIKGLTKLSTNGRYSIQTSLKHLEEKGYVRRMQVLDKKNRFGRTKFFVYPYPVFDPESEYSEFAPDLDALEDELKEFIEDEDSSFFGVGKKKNTVDRFSADGFSATGKKNDTVNRFSAYGKSAHGKKNDTVSRFSADGFSANGKSAYGNSVDGKSAHGENTDFIGVSSDDTNFIPTHKTSTVNRFSADGFSAHDTKNDTDDRFSVDGKPAYGTENDTDDRFSAYGDDEYDENVDFMGNSPDTQFSIPSKESVTVNRFSVDGKPAAINYLKNKINKNKSLSVIDKEKDYTDHSYTTSRSLNREDTVEEDIERPVSLTKGKNLFNPATLSSLDVVDDSNFNKKLMLDSIDHENRKLPAYDLEKDDYPDELEIDTDLVVKYMPKIPLADNSEWMMSKDIYLDLKKKYPTVNFHSVLAYLRVCAYQNPGYRKTPIEIDDFVENCIKNYVNHLREDETEAEIELRHKSKIYEEMRRGWLAMIAKEKEVTTNDAK